MSSLLGGSLGGSRNGTSAASLANLLRENSSTGLTALRMQDGLNNRNSSVEDFLSLVATGDIPHQDPSLLNVPLMQHQQSNTGSNMSRHGSAAAVLAQQRLLAQATGNPALANAIASRSFGSLRNLSGGLLKSNSTAALLARSGGDSTGSSMSLKRKLLELDASHEKGPSKKSIWEMSSSRSMSEASTKRAVANSQETGQSYTLVNQGDQWQHRLFRDRSLNAETSRTRQGQNLGLSPVDMAYHKLGQQLSVRAHGSFVASIHRRSSTIGEREGSSFTLYNRSFKRINHTHVGLVSEECPLCQFYCDNFLHLLQFLKGGLAQTLKAAKTRPINHENSQKVPPRKRNVLRLLTMNASKILRILQDDRIAGSETARPTNASQQHSPQLRPQQKNERAPSNRLQEGTKKEQATNEFSNKNIISLPQNQDSAPNIPSHSVQKYGPQHLQSKPPSATGKASFHQNQPGKCLTDISTPTNGFDNANGDLILYENDIIRVPRNKIHVLTKERMRDVTHVDYRVQRRLGQGTFAQVFQCVDLQTGTLVALKIVKNKAAYARQASVEIDVLRALRTKVENDGNKLNMQQAAVDRSSSDGKRGKMYAGDEQDYMVDLVCYFLYKSHLCMVFELLGQNLYDVLKQRNFRGLRLSVVRSVLSQAVHGITELAKHGVVHCDIKPENVLLVNENDTTHAGNQQCSDNTLASSSISAQTASLISTQPQHNTAQAATPSTTANQRERPQVMFTSAAPTSQSATTKTQYHRIKLIDFGSACFNGQTMQTYIQSRFYRSPEVLIGLPYDSAIDIWSLGCVAAELFLGLPILPGVHEHDQLGRILEMISTLPEWMLDQGSKASFFFDREAPFDAGSNARKRPQKNEAIDEGHTSNISSLPNKKWRLKSPTEFIASLSEDEIQRKGGRLKLEKQHHSRYFKKKRLADIVLHKGQSGTTKEDKYDLDLFVHFLYGASLCLEIGFIPLQTDNICLFREGLLDPDPRKRWTAQQASHHPFLSSSRMQEHTEQTYVESRISGNVANLVGTLYWEPPTSFKATGGNANTTSNKFVGKHTGSRFRHQQTRNQFSEQLRSNGPDVTAHRRYVAPLSMFHSSQQLAKDANCDGRVPMPSESLGDLTQSFGQLPPSNIANGKTSQFVPPPHSSASAFTAMSEKGGQTQSLHNGQILPPFGLSQQTQNTWQGRLRTENSGILGGNWAVNASPRHDNVQTQVFASPVNSQCNQYGSSSKASDERRPGFSMPNHAFREHTKGHRPPVVYHGGK
ncbi:MAG: hypothetical protein SGBAC_012074 [Bacillariaceae sp.]